VADAEALGATAGVDMLALYESAADRAFAAGKHDIAMRCGEREWRERERACAEAKMAQTVRSKRRQAQQNRRQIHRGASALSAHFLISLSLCYPRLTSRGGGGG
jgi:hypothetical protein